MNKKGFTLIELLAVIVILAIIALIATPIVMNVINKAQEGADLRSIEAYGKEVESLYYQKLIEDPEFKASDISTLTPALSGDTVSCTAAMNETTNEITLSNCSINGVAVDYTYSSKTGAVNP